MRYVRYKVFEAQYNYCIFRSYNHRSCKNYYVVTYCLEHGLTHRVCRVQT